MSVPVRSSGAGVVELLLDAATPAPMNALTSWVVAVGRRVERVTGIEPAFSAWEADVLPLNYTRLGTTRNLGAVSVPGR